MHIEVGRDAPAWYVNAIAAQPRSARVEVRGATLHLREWGPTSGPTTVLVHGGAAHSGWWDHLAPGLARSGRVIALDSSGQGDSTWRDAYSLESWAQELCHALTILVPNEPVTLVGHSRGGMISLLASAGIANLQRLVVVEGTFGVKRPGADGNPRPHRIYTDFDEAVRRFRTLPDEARLDYLMPHIARQSVRKVEGGWTWKFDPRLQGIPALEPEDVQPAVVPTTLVRGELGLASAEVIAHVRARLGADAQVVTIPDAGHHIMLNQPVALAEELTRHVAS